MEPTLPPAQLTGFAAPLLQVAVTIGLIALCGLLYQRYRKRYFLYWALAWMLYALRLAAILTFLATDQRVWLFWHQVITGWTALAILWAALVFSRQLRLETRYLAVALFPLIWSYIAIYQLESFLMAAGPAVAFLSGATVWTGWVFVQHTRKVGSRAAALLAVTLFLWGLHHLDYPFFRARGAWNPWGYYLDIIFELCMGAGIVLLVLEDLERGLRTLSTLSGDLQRGQDGSHPDDGLAALLERPLALPAVRGSALFLRAPEPGRYVGGSGSCRDWGGTAPTGASARAIAKTLDTAQPEIVHGLTNLESDRPDGHTGSGSHSYFAALPVLRGESVTGALVIVGEARDPFAALDDRFLTALGQQVGAALENADLYRRLEARTAELERLTSHMLRQHEGERRRLSRELHDETAQVFSAVKLQLGLIREHATTTLAQRLDRVLDLVDTGIRSIRNVTNMLRPPLLDELGLVPTLRALVEEFEVQSGLLVTLDAPSAVGPLPEDVELALFRALQEGLANVGRHADATVVAVMLSTEAGRLELVVRDNGRGLPDEEFEALERRGQLGLTGMRERVVALGGTVALTPPDDGGQGAQLTISIPFAESP